MRKKFEEFCGVQADSLHVRIVDVLMGVLGLLVGRAVVAQPGDPANAPALPDEPLPVAESEEPPVAAEDEAAEDADDVAVARERLKEHETIQRKLLDLVANIDNGAIKSPADIRGLQIERFTKALPKGEDPAAALKAKGLCAFAEMSAEEQRDYTTMYYTVVGELAKAGRAAS